jgi:hypothetical protein
MKTKICTKCKRELPLEAFGKCTKAKDGLKARCKECRNEIKRDYNRTHKQQIHDYRQLYMKTHVEELKISRKKYKTEHKAEIKIKSKIYYNTHKEQIKKYKEENKEKISARKKVYYREQYKVYCKKGEEEKVMYYAEAKADNFIGWVRHHRLETHTSDGFLRSVQLSKAELIALDMYYNRPAKELIWLKAGEHRTVHGNLKGN